jgi:DNA invertase Pin-like site-specific DNA recombinase
MLIGYARVSSTHQSLEVQLEQLHAAGCEKVFAEKRSGRNAADRPQLQEALEFVREGDALTVTRIDRLARSVGDLQDIVRQLRAKKVDLKATEQPVDTSTAAGKAFLDMLGVFAEFEANLRAERQRDGIEAAKAKGVYKGRAPTLDRARILELHAQKVRPVDIARQLKIGRASVYRALASTQGAEEPPSPPVAALEEPCLT